MKFVEAECPNCGAQLQLNNSGKTAFCNHCGSKIIVNKAIEPANTILMSIEKRIQNGEVLLRLGEYEKAKDIFDKVTLLAPERYEGWLGLFNAESENGEKFSIKYCENLENALECVNSNEKAKKRIDSIYNKYTRGALDIVSFKELQNTVYNNYKRISDLSRDIDDLEKSSQENINEKMQTFKTKIILLIFLCILIVLVAIFFLIYIKHENLSKLILIATLAMLSTRIKRIDNFRNEIKLIKARIERIKSIKNVSINELKKQLEEISNINNKYEKQLKELKKSRDKEVV